MLDLLSLKVLEITRQRLLGLSKKEIFSAHPELAEADNEHLMNYGNQGSTYYFDYNITTEEGMRGIEGGISEDNIKIVEYTSSTDDIFKLSISELPSNMSEAEFFQISLVEDLGNLTLEQLNAILVIRDIISDGKIDWGVK